MNIVQEKRSSSTPSTQLKSAHKEHPVLHRAFSEKHSFQQQKNQQQKLSLQKLCQRLIGLKNTQNIQKSIPYAWSILLIEEKRTITGIKVRLKCKYIQHISPFAQHDQQSKNSTYIVVRLSFTLDYFKAQSISQGNIFIQLDQINFELTKSQKRKFQSQIEEIIRPSLVKKNYHEQQEEGRWIRQLFNGIQTILHSNHNFLGKSKNGSDFINRREINKNYMPYHPPVSFAWNPKGNFCITQNKIPANRNSFIGNPISFRLHLQALKFQGLNKINEEQIAQTVNTSDNQRQSIFNWDVKQQLDLVSLSKHSKEDIELYYSNQKYDQKSKFFSIATLKHDAQIVVLDYLSKVSPITRKVYQRYFIKFEQQNTLQQFHRGDRLKVFAINDKMRRFQDQMIYLIDKMNNDKLKPVLQVILSNQFVCYPNILSNSTNSIDTLRYYLISHFLKENSASCKQNYNQKFQYKQRNSQINNLNLNFMMCLKSIIVENQNFSVELQKYFKNGYKMVGIKPTNLYYIGSYFHFDQFKAEKALMDLMRQYLQITVANQDNQNQKEQIVCSKVNDRFRKFVKVKSLKKFPNLYVEWILTEQQRKKLIQIMLPILLVRDRSSNSSQFRQIQRILAANAKMIKFYKKLNQMVGKLQQKKYQFIQNLINSYELFLDYRKNSQMNSDLRRCFVVYCQICSKTNKTFELIQSQKLIVCQKCRSNLQN